MIAGRLEIEMLANLARLQKDMNEARGMLTSFGRHAQQTISTVQTAFAGLGAGLSIAAFAAMVKGAIDAADKLNDLSKSTSIAVEDLAGLKLLAQQTGTDLDGLAKGINKMSVEMGKSPEKFKALGVTAKDPIAAFRQLADIFNNLTDVQQRNALAQAVFSKSWAELAPALSEGGRRIGEIVEKGKRLSGMTKELAVNSDEFNDQMAELNMTLAASKTKLVSDMLPSMNEIAAAMREAAKEGGLLTTVWVGLGGVMAHILGMTDAQRMKDRLKEVNDAIEIARKQLAAGSLNPAGASSNFWNFLIPDVKLTEEAKERLRETLTALEAERKRLMPPAPGDLALPGGNTAAELAARADAARRAAAFLKDGEDQDAAYRGLVKTLKEKLLVDHELSEVAKLQLTLDAMSAKNLATITPARRKELMELAAQVDQLKVSKDAREAYVKTMEADAALEQEVADLVAARATKEGDAIKAQHEYLENLRFETTLIGKNNIEREQAIALRALEKSGIDKFSAEYARLVAAITQEIRAKQTAEALNPKLLEQYRFETTLIGMTNEQREIAIRLRELELKGIDANTEGFEEYVSKLRQAVAERQFAEESRNLLVGMWSDVDRVAHDTFTNIDQVGTATFNKLRDTLKNGAYSLLYSLTARPLLINLVTSTAGPAVAQSVFGAAANGVTPLSVLNGASSAKNLLGTAGLLNTGTVGSLQSGMGVMTAAPVVEAGEIISGAQYASLTSGAGFGAFAAANAIPIIGGAIGLGLLAKSLLGGSKEPAVGTGYQLSGAFGPDVLNIMSAAQTNRGPQALASQLSNAVYTGAFEGLADSLEKLLTPIIGADAARVHSTTGTFSFAQGMGVSDVETAAKMVAGVSESIALQLVPGLEELQRNGETALDTVTRLSGAFTLTDDIARMLGRDVGDVFGAVGLAAADMRDALVELMGGLEAATSQTAFYFENFYSGAERTAIRTAAITEELAALGLALPETRAEFRALVESQDLATAGGREMYASLMKLAPAFAEISAAMDDAAATATTLAGRIAAMQAEALKLVQDQVSASRAASSEAQRMADTYGGIAKSLRDAITNIRGGAGATAADFNSLFATAMGGNVDSLSALPGAAQQFLEAARARSRTGTEFALEQAKVISMLSRAGALATTEQTDAQRRATLSEAQVAVLERIEEQLQKPSPDAAILAQQRDLLASLGSYSADQLAAIVADSSVQADGISIVGARLGQLVDLMNEQLGVDSATAAAKAIADAQAAAAAAEAARQAADAKAAAAAAAAVTTSTAAAQAAALASQSAANAALVAALSDDDILARSGFYRSGTGIRRLEEGSLATNEEDQFAFLAQLREAYLASLPGHAAGLPYVPTDDYAARLHRGEAVLPYSEAAAWRQGGNARVEALLEQLIAREEATLAAIERFSMESRSGTMSAYRLLKNIDYTLENVTEGGNAMRIQQTDDEDPLRVQIIS